MLHNAQRTTAVIRAADDTQMPELPEVETVARQLHPLLREQTVRAVRIVDSARLALDRPRRLLRRRVQAVYRLGKLVVAELGAPALYLAVHLRMTGRLIWRPLDDARGAPTATERHLRAWLQLERGWLLLFDPRRFGVVTLVADRATLEPAAVDPLRERLSPTLLGRLIGDSRQPLKTWLLRQDRLVGLGNIYASEILFHARLHPQRLAGTLSPTELRRLCGATRSVLEAAVAACGTTFSDFQGAHGLTGTYQRYLAAYGRDGQPCPRCQRPIARIVQQQRSTFFCPRCQPLDDPRQCADPDPVTRRNAPR